MPTSDAVTSLLTFKNNIMQRLIRQAENYCKNLNKSVQASYEYNEAILYAKFGGSIGIGKCSEIAQKYCA